MLMRDSTPMTVWIGLAARKCPWLGETDAQTPPQADLATSAFVLATASDHGGLPTHVDQQSIRSTPRPPPVDHAA